jgi:hypothetical protein
MSVEKWNCWGHIDVCREMELLGHIDVCRDMEVLGHIDVCRDMEVLGHIDVCREMEVLGHISCPIYPLYFPSQIPQGKSKLHAPTDALRYH